MIDKFYHYNKNLKKYSTQLRNNSTLAEIILWNEVLKGRKLGYQFHRQRPILKYIADFFCKDLKLIIETDGATHTYEEVRVKDKEKQENLIENGYTLLRFEDTEVVCELEKVRSKIQYCIKDYEYAHPEISENKRRNKRS